MNRTTVATGTAAAAIAAAIVGGLNFFGGLDMPGELATTITVGGAYPIDYIIRWLPRAPTDASPEAPK